MNLKPSDYDDNQSVSTTSKRTRLIVIDDGIVNSDMNFGINKVRPCPPR